MDYNLFIECSVHLSSDGNSLAHAGDYLKMRRALIRAVEKQAAVTDRLESIKYAIGEDDITAVKSLVQENLKQIKQVGGDIESLGERELF